jgi:hypothetical protein
VEGPEALRYVLDFNHEESREIPPAVSEKEV